jgi:hypothetical protein
VKISSTATINTNFQMTLRFKISSGAGPALYSASVTTPEMAERVTLTFTFSAIFK